MLKIGKTLLNAVPQIALVVSDREPNALLRPLRIDVLEIRIDQFRRYDLDYIKENVLKRKALGVPLILTIRNTKKEGGMAHISDAVKLRIFQTLVPLVDAFDIELSSPIIFKVIQLARKNKKPIIVSAHNFKNTPSPAALEKIFKAAVQKGANIVKIATKANSLDDVNQLWQFTIKHQKDNVITMSLGKIGSISRLVFPAAGSLLTYSHVGNPSAPGQLPLGILQGHVRLYYPGYKSR